MKEINIPLPWGGRLHIVFEKNGAAHINGLKFGTKLEATVFHNDRNQGSMILAEEDLGSGLVTNVGVSALANDFAWSVTNAPNNLFR